MDMEPERLFSVPSVKRFLPRVFPNLPANMLQTKQRRVSPLLIAPIMESLSGQILLKAPAEHGLSLCEIDHLHVEIRLDPVNHLEVGHVTRNHVSHQTPKDWI